MKSLSAIFWKGAATLLPLVVTLYLLYWTVVSLEHLLSYVVPRAWYFPGSGLLLVIVFIGVFGLLMHFLLFEWLVDLGSRLLNRIPIVKSLYSALQDFLAYLGHRSSEDLSRVVLVTLADDLRLIGFVTNPAFELTGGDGATVSGRVSVYLPMSYQIGGFMVLLPAERLQPLDISVEDAMRLVLTAGVRSRSPGAVERERPNRPDPHQQ